MRTWAEIEKKRKVLDLSRAEMCRRAGINESTVTKGMKRASGKPGPTVRRILLGVLETEELAQASSHRKDDAA